MSTERTKDVARFFGLFMFVVQLRLLFKFVVATKDEYDGMSYMPLSDVWARMDWLKPAPFSGAWLASYASWFALFATAICLALWVAGFVRWFRQRNATDE